MAFETGIVTNASGSFTLAHQNLLELIKNKLTSAAFMGAGQNWVAEEYVSTGNHRLIVRGPGLSGTDQIYVGIELYHDQTADYYNCQVRGFTGFVPGNTFATQPGSHLNGLGVPLHNQSISYWLVANGQRFALALKVGTPVYESFYLGKFFPYASPSQYPYPICAIGMLTSAAATRFSDTIHFMGYKGNVVNLQMRFVTGVWQNPQAWPWNNVNLSAAAGLDFSLRETPTDNYPLLPVVLNDTINIYGELDGIFFVSAFNNVVENTITIGSDTYLVVQDVFRTGFRDYYALKLA